MTPITRTLPSTTARRRAASAAHRAAEGTVTAYLRDMSAQGRRRPPARRPGPLPPEGPARR